MGFRETRKSWPNCQAQDTKGPEDSWGWKAVSWTPGFAG